MKRIKRTETSLLPKGIPVWIVDVVDREDYVEGWKACFAGRPEAEGPANRNSRWYTGWADALKVKNG